MSSPAMARSNTGEARDGSTGFKIVRETAFDLRTSFPKVISQDNEDGEQS